MSAQQTAIAVVLASARHGRRCRPIADWVIDGARRHPAIRIEDIDPECLPLSFGAQPLPNDAWRELETRLQAADGVVVVTPEYHHGYTAVLKQLIDAVPDVWQARPLAFVSYGGAAGGRRAVRQLVSVFESLGALPLAETVSLANVAHRFTADNEFRPDAADDRSLETLLAGCIEQAHAVRRARAPMRAPATLPRFLTTSA